MTSTLPKGPSIAGLTYRTYRGESDILPIVGLMRACNAANGVTRHDSADSMRLRLAAMDRVDPHEDVVVGFMKGRLVAFSSVVWDDTSYGERHYRASGWVHPQWRRRGIGGAMWERNERRLTDIASHHGDASTRVLTVVLPALDAGGLALAVARGYRKVRVYHHMVRPDLDDIDVRPMPEGLEVGAMSQALLPQLWDAASEAWQDEFGAADTSETAYRRWIGDPLLDLDLLSVAFDHDEIAGAVHGVIDPSENEQQGYLRGWTDPIYVRRPWRRRGLASALIGRTLVRLRDRGMTSAQLDVDSENENAAFALYLNHGFKVERSASEWHKPLSV